MGFRLACPGMTEERCRGCKMLGGRTIETDDEAQAFTLAMRAHPEVWTREESGPIRVGETLEMEPCVAPDYEAMYGRECPRVELWPENQPAAELVFAALPEHTRGLLPAYVEAVTAELGPAAHAVVRRAFAVLRGDAVTGWLKAQYEAKPEGDS